MVSDVLFETIPVIEDYLKTPMYRDTPEGAMVDELVQHMKKVLRILDTPPGTNGETTAENVS